MREREEEGYVRVQRPKMHVKVGGKKKKKKKRGQGQGAGAWREEDGNKTREWGLPTPRIETRGILFSFYSKGKGAVYV